VALLFGGDFFLAGNRPSLTAMEDQEPTANGELRPRTANDEQCTTFFQIPGNRV
jgi:hypothetical protein